MAQRVESMTNPLPDDSGAFTSLVQAVLVGGWTLGAGIFTHIYRLIAQLREQIVSDRHAMRGEVQAAVAAIENKARADVAEVRGQIASGFAAINARLDTMMDRMRHD